MAPSRPGLRAAVTLTVMRHAQREAFLEAAVLALVPVLLLNLAAPLALLIFQLHANRPAEETLQAGGMGWGRRGAGGQGNSSVSTRVLGSGWFITPRNLVEVQPGGEEELWVSLTQAESLSQGEVVWWEKGAAEEEPWRAAQGLVPDSVCVILQAASREGWRHKLRAGPSLQECLAGPRRVTQPRWHLLWGKEFQRHIQSVASDPRGINTELTADLQHRKHR